MAQENTPFELSPPDISKEIFQDLEKLNGEKRIHEMRFAVKETKDFLEALRPKVKDIDGFWANILNLHASVRVTMTSSSDQHALSYLSDIELVQDINDPRPYELVFHFKENPYFSDKTLNKTFSLLARVSPAPEHGSITQQMIEFDSEDLVPSSIKINWKSDDVNLSKKQPRRIATAEGDDHDEFEGDFGSFFCFFEEKEDVFSVGEALQADILPNAIDYLSGRGENSIRDFDFDDDELDEDEEDDAASVDLEDEEDQPKKKKTKV